MKLTSHRRVALVLAALLASVSAVFLQVRNHEFLHYDDSAYVTDNPHVLSGLTTGNVVWALTSVDTLTANWHPVTWLSHMLDVELYGVSSGGHHLSSVALHALSSMILFVLLARMTGSPWPSAFVAACFALHPTRAESVAWVSERKDVLCAFFGFLSLLFYSRYARRERPILSYATSLLTFALGLMSKPMLVTLPVVVLLVDYWPLARYGGEGPTGLRRFGSLVKEKLPFFAMSVLSAAATVYAQHEGGAIAALDKLPVTLRLENALVSYARYLVEALWPVDLAVLYPFPPLIPVWQIAGSLVLVVAVTLATLHLRTRHPYLFVGWSWFLVTLLPVIGIIQVGVQSMADRYTYIPLIGLAVMVAWGVPELGRWLRLSRYVVPSLAGAVLVIYAVATSRQVAYWHDDLTLFGRALEVTTDNYVAHNGVGVALLDQGRAAEAAHMFREALRIRPHADFHSNLGKALYLEGDRQGAIREFQEALRTDSPQKDDIHRNLGVALNESGDREGAIREFRSALVVNPANTNARNSLALALAESGETDGAVAELRKVVREKPDHPTAHNSLGLALTRQGRLGAAVAEFQDALRVTPNDASIHNNLGIALATMGQLDAAVREFQEALRLEPTHPGVRRNLDIALSQKSLRDQSHQ